MGAAELAEWRAGRAREEKAAEAAGMLLLYYSQAKS